MPHSQTGTTATATGENLTSGDTPDFSRSGRQRSDREEDGLTREERIAQRQEEREARAAERREELEETHNIITGTDEDDVLDGTDGDDAIYGMDGNDLISAGGGNDIVRAGDGNDTVYGGDGDDKLGGGCDDDDLSGGGGNDTLFGGQGDDQMSGGTGADQFVFMFGKNGHHVRSGDDTIRDFSLDDGDTLRVVGANNLDKNFTYGDSDGDGIDDYTIITFTAHGRPTEDEDGNTIVEDIEVGSITLLNNILTEADFGF